MDLWIVALNNWNTVDILGHKPPNKQANRYILRCLGQDLFWSFSLPKKYFVLINKHSLKVTFPSYDVILEELEFGTF